MADNVTLNGVSVGGGKVMRTYDVGGFQIPVSALVFADGTDVSDSAPLPVKFASAQHVIVDSATLGVVSVTGTVTANLGTLGGAATAANQATEITALQSLVAALDVALSTRASQTTVAAILSALAGGLPVALGAGGGVKVDGSGTPLPVSGTVAITNSNIDAAGALATSALQTTGNTSLSSIASNTSTTATNTGRIPAQGRAAATGSLPIVTATPTVTAFSSLPTAGQQFGSGAVSGIFGQFINSTGGSILIMAFDATTTRTNGTVPLQVSATATSGSAVGLTLGSITYALPFSSGLWIQATSTLATMTSIASTAVTGYMEYLS